MKKTLLLFIGLCSAICYCQKTAKNEVKFNLPYFALGIPEVNYERIIDSTRAVGIAVAVTLDNPTDIETRFSIIPYYRWYFEKDKSAGGFFIEGNTAILNKKQWIYYGSTTVWENNTYFGIGGAAGYKLLNKSNIIAEVFAGLGLELDCCDEMFYPRLGVSIGKRF